ncbi:hypothetical protein H0H87_010306, partial [Tephrocybe sp. NHM501043]
ESRVISTNDINLTHELHVIQAHLLHYASLLDDFRKTVVFVQATPYPGLDNPSLYTPESRERSKALMMKECGNLLSEIQRLEKARVMQGKRLKNVMNLVGSEMVADRSRIKLTAMKQVAYLTMFFLPASLVAVRLVYMISHPDIHLARLQAIFGMNVHELNGSKATVPLYLGVAIPLTVLTCWIIISFQFRPEYEHEEPSLFWRILGRIGWPVTMGMDLLRKREKERRGDSWE